MADLNAGLKVGLTGITERQLGLCMLWAYMHPEADGSKETSALANEVMACWQRIVSLEHLVDKKWKTINGVEHSFELARGQLAEADRKGESDG